MLKSRILTMTSICLSLSTDKSVMGLQRSCLSPGLPISEAKHLELDQTSVG